MRSNAMYTHSMGKGNRFLAVNFEDNLRFDVIGWFFN